MQSDFTRLAEVEARLQEAIGELRVQQSLVPDIDCPQQRTILTTLLANGLRIYCWLEDLHNGLLERIAAEQPLSRD